MTNLFIKYYSLDKKSLLLFYFISRIYFISGIFSQSYKSIQHKVYQRKSLEILLISIDRTGATEIQAAALLLFVLLTRLLFSFSKDRLLKIFHFNRFGTDFFEKNILFNLLMRNPILWIRHKIN